MNFIKGLFKFLCFFFIGVFLWPVFSSAEIKKTFFESEAVRSELVIPTSLFTESVNDFLFDLKGTLIFSSAKKVGVYNGLRWDFIELSFEPAISISPDGTIFIGAGSVVYSLEVDHAQNYFLSEYALIPNEEKELIKQIICYDNGILIKTFDNLYSYVSNEFQKIINNGEDIHIFKTKSRTIIRNGNKYAGFSISSGLGSWTESKDRYIHIEDHPQGYIAYSETEAAFSILSPSFSSQKLWSQKFSGKVLDILHLPDDSYGILTDEQSFYQINAIGETLSLTELSELNKNSSLKVSSMDRIWVSNSYGFSILDFSLPFQEINIDHLKSGLISSCYSNGKLFVSDGYGLYELPGKLMLKSGKIHSLTPINEGFLFLEDEILYYYSEGESRQVWKDKILNFKVDPIEKVILLDLSDQFAIVKPTFSGYFEEQKCFDKSFDKEYIFCDNSLHYYAEHTIYRINIETLKKDSLFFSPKDDGLKIFQLMYSKNIYLVGTQKNVYLLKSDSTQIFYEPDDDAKHSEQRIVFANSDFALTYWVENAETPGFIKLISPDGRKESIRFFPKGLSVFNNLSILRAGEGEYFLINPNRIFHYSTEESNNRKEFFVVPLQIRINGKEVFAGQIFDHGKTQLRNAFNKIPYKNNSFEMEFSSSDFLSADNKFQYILKGRDEEWSEWVTGNKLKFQKLKPGDYLLYLRLNNVNNYISDTLKLNFTVLSPFYYSVYAIVLYILLFLTSMFVIYRWYVLYSHNNSEKEIEKIKIEAFHKSEPTDDLPEEEVSSAKIKEKKTSKWDKFTMVTVLFSDIQGFTKIAEMMNPEKLIDELDQFFFHFDSVVDKYNIEKIKTIGDAYMAAGGIPVRNITNPVEVVLAALEMQQYMKQLKKTKVDIWDLRIGIHTGPVIAGEIGHKKRSYDIWGDSVNIASRMESSGEPGKVNISGITYNLIKDFFICEYRGKIPVKYKGNLDMYFVTGLRPELSINLVGLPNKMFFLKLQIKRLADLEEFVFNKLDIELPKSLCFHTSVYARQVYNHVFLLSKSESLDVEESLEVRTASLLLHLGYINNYKNPAVESANNTYEILNKFQYSERQINIITNLILSTKQPYEPQNIMEQIMIDAKMEYLGRADFIKNSRLLFQEENEMLTPKDPEQWKSEQIDLLKSFEYFTPGGRRLREISFEEQIEKLLKDKR